MPFLEKQIQTITENNLEIIFGFQFVCSEFSTGSFRREAARFKDLPLGLCQVHLYSNNTIGYSMIKQPQSTASVKTFSQTSDTIARVSSEIDVYTEERLLAGKDEDIKQAFWAIRDIIQQINPDVESRVKKSMVCYYTDGRGLVWVRPATKKITLWLRKGIYDGRYAKVKPEGWGKYPELRLSAQDIDLLYVRDLLQQANSK